MKVVVSAFAPFAGDPENSSELILHALENRPGIKKVSLPVVFGLAAEKLAEVVRAERPQFVLAMGLAENRDYFSLERVALNIRDARIPDNAGAQPVNQPVDPLGELALGTDWPSSDQLKIFEESDLDVRLSFSAGTFVCNDVFYSLLKLGKELGFAATFLHVPRLIEQKTAEVPGRSVSKPKWSVSQACRVVDFILESTGSLKVNDDKQQE